MRRASDCRGSHFSIGNARDDRDDGQDQTNRRECKSATNRAANLHGAHRRSGDGTDEQSPMPTSRTAERNSRVGKSIRQTGRAGVRSAKEPAVNAPQVVQVVVRNRPFVGRRQKPFRLRRRPRPSPRARYASRSAPWHSGRGTRSGRRAPMPRSRRRSRRPCRAIASKLSPFDSSPPVARFDEPQYTTAFGVLNPHTTNL